MRFRSLLLIMLLAACGDLGPPPPPTPSPLAFTPIDRALAGSPRSASTQLTTIGYVLVDQDGARLVESLSVSASPTPQPLADASAQLWLGADTPSAIAGSLRRAGGLRYALVVARGRLEGPGSYGPDGAHRYQLTAPQLQPLVPDETSIAELADRAKASAARPVRVVGALLAHGKEALLVERLGNGGLPDAQARQIKLRAPLRDTRLLDQLQRAAGGSLRYGQVQIEGLWQGGMLTPLSIALVR